jgi:hypothetical protein
MAYMVEGCLDYRRHTYDLTRVVSDNILIGDIMSTIIERLRSRHRVDTSDGLAELLEEAAREIERLRIKVGELEQQVNVNRPYSSAEWSNDS